MWVLLGSFASWGCVFWFSLFWLIVFWLGLVAFDVMVIFCSLLCVVIFAICWWLLLCLVVVCVFGCLLFLG